MILVVSGPGGAGKGSIVDRLAAGDPALWVSRSWTTRPRRESESEDAYVFVGREEFEAAAAGGRFLEWAEVVPGQFSGTPLPEAPPGRDLVLEINVEGARQVKARHPEAVVVLVIPPSEEAQAERMRRRGDSAEAIEARVELGRAETAEGRPLADAVVVNDDLDRAVAEVAGILQRHR